MLPTAFRTRDVPLVFLAKDDGFELLSAFPAAVFVNRHLFSLIPNYCLFDELAHGQQEPCGCTETNGDPRVAGDASGAARGAHELAVTETRCPAEGYADEDFHDEPHFFALFLPSIWGNA